MSKYKNPISLKRYMIREWSDMNNKREKASNMGHKMSTQ